MHLAKKEKVAMPDRRTPRRWFLVALLAIATAFSGAPALAAPAAQPAPPTAPPGAAPIQSAFAAAAREFGVPERILLALSYNLSRWDTHAGAPSVAGGYGPMHLTHVDRVPQQNQKGDERARAPQPAQADPALHTLDAAAALLGLPPDTLKRDAAQNIRGGAALLASYARASGALPASEADWYAAVAAYSHSSDLATAADFADAVYATIQQGATRAIDTGETVTLAPANVVPNRPPSLAGARRRPRDVDCPQQMPCEFIPAAYQLNPLPDGSTDPSDYGNYDLADRPHDGLDIRYIVIHDTETDYNTTLQIFQNPRNYVSAHYVIRSSDGHVAQMVRTQNVAWHAGNWYVNAHSIGIEHEGVAIEGATWYTEAMYRSSARLVHYLAVRYHIPLDRAHIVGHDDIPHPTTGQAGMHWDPGPFWDWAHYMDLLGAPIKDRNDRQERARGIVTIAPDFERNQRTLTYCYDAEVADCRAVPRQPSNFVYLHTAPDINSPLVTNQYIDSGGVVTPTLANNWGNKAVTGQMFYRVDRRNGWDGIYFGGQVAWFRNPDGDNTAAGAGVLITPKAGLASIPVYGRAYPEAEAYPAGTTPQAIVPVDKYSLLAGQKYVATGPFKSDYYYAPTYAPTLEGSDHVVVAGQTEYYQIFYNHRFIFVKASDVDTVGR
jgi:N-acetyl-anhydromuramyl-L-alanine amidase AmpD